MRLKRNRHHPIHDRVDWTSRREAEYIREHPASIFVMDVDLHQELHKNTPAVPLLGVHALQRVVRIWQPNVQDKFQSIENLQMAIEKAAAHPKSHWIESELARLAVEAIELQKPYLKESLPLQRIHIV